MPLFLPLFLTAFAAYSGVIQGVVVEHASGKPMGRALVRVDPIPGTPLPPQPLVTRASRSGVFVFTSVPPGLYRLSTQRLGYAPAFYGQRRPDGQAAPVAVTQDSRLFAELRLRRLGAITGTVVDENGVGLPGVGVVAYTAALPLRSAGRGVADDRGVYRIPGLMPGRYWVRSAAHTLEDGVGLLPTYAPQGVEVREARSYDVRLDTETPDAYVRPETGQLFTLRVEATCDRTSPITVTLTSEIGSQSQQGSCAGAYQFERLAPLTYELVATNQEATMVAFGEVVLRRDTTASLRLSPPPLVSFDMGTSTGVTITGRRADLAGLSPPVEIPTPRTWLVPGYWNLTAAVAGPSQYVETLSLYRQDIRRPWRPERPSDAHEIYVEQWAPLRMKVLVSDKAAQISGTVTAEKQPVPGSPVFLFPLSDANRRILGGSRETLGDVDGRFRFDGLPPGEYRLLATFDATSPTPELLDEAQAKSFRLESSQAATFDLPLWVAP